MTNSDCNQTSRAGPLARPQYLAGSYLTAADCAAEQDYRLQRVRRHNRRLHSWGVVCGLLVGPARDSARPWAVQVCPGFAIGPYGDEIEMVEPVKVDIKEYLWSRPTASLTTHAGAGFAYVVVRHREVADRLAPLPAASCECEEPVYATSRILDGIDAAILWAAPPAMAEPDLCARGGPCPPCPASPWLYLARVLLPGGSGAAITTAMIDNGIRRNL